MLQFISNYSMRERERERERVITTNFPDEDVQASGHPSGDTINLGES
jgi:hypothetical protein